MRRALALKVGLLGVGIVTSLGADAAAQRQPGWEVRIPARVQLTVGEAGELPLAIAVDRGLTVSRDAPVLVDVSVPAGLTVKKPRLERRDAVDPGADAPRFAIPLHPTAAGTYIIEIRIRFWVCGGWICRPVDVRRQVASDTP